MTAEEQSEYVAAKLGIIYLCENCCKRVHSVNDKVGNQMAWIHDETETTTCNGAAYVTTTEDIAFPASLQTVEDLFFPSNIKKSNPKQNYSNDDDNYQ